MSSKENNMDMHDIIMWSALHSASLEGINEVNHASLLSIIDEAIKGFITLSLLHENFGSHFSLVILHHVFNGLSKRERRQCDASCNYTDWFLEKCIAQGLTLTEDP